MSKQSIPFAKNNTFLQGNKISISFGPIADPTVVDDYATQYRYRYRCKPIYCGEGTEPYAYYKTDDPWTEVGAWIEVQKDSGSGDVSFDTIIPRVSYDALFNIEVQVYEDGTGQYYTSTEAFSPNFIGFYNQEAQIQLNKVERENGTIALDYTIVDTGICKPGNLTVVANRGYNSSQWQNYCKNFLLSFCDASNTFLTINCICSKQKNMSNPWSGECTVYDQYNFYNYHAGDSAIELTENLFDDLESRGYTNQSNLYFRLQFNYNLTGKDFSFRVADKTTNIVLLSAATSSFQIKRRGVKAQMLENDPVLGTFSTGAGMFNHGEEVGVDISGETPTHNSDLGHSIALYDTRADGASASNKPSIGFMDNNHKELASLSYDGKKLVSTKPIWWEGQDIGGGGGGGSSHPENEIELVAYFPNGNRKTFLITSNFTFAEKQ